MTTLIVLPTPTPPRAPAQQSAGADAGTDAPNASFADALDAAITGQQSEDAGEGTGDPATTADGATLPHAHLALVPSLPLEAEAETEAGAATGDADATPTADALTALLAGGAAPAAEAGATEATTPATTESDTTVPTATSTRTGLLTTPGQPAQGDATGRPASDATPPAPAAEAAQRTADTTSEGDAAPQARVEGGPADPRLGHAERSGAGAGRAAPAPTPDAPQTQDPTTPAVAATTQSDRAPAVTATTAPARPVATQVLEQIQPRLPMLRASAPGTHVMTMRLEPEHFGPLRLVAHIGADGVRIELLGATEAARDALRAALPDLKRDLVGVGLTADLDLDARGQQGQAARADADLAGDAGARGDRDASGDRPASAERGERAPEPNPTTTTAAARRGRLDLTV